MYDLIIVGAGPAGCAAAIHAANLRPQLASRILVLDKARFPRVKICGGGIVRRGDYLLHRLGVDPEVDSAPIDAARFIFPSGAVTLSRRKMFRVVRREAFDHALLQSVQSRAIEVRQATTVLDLQRADEGVLVDTADGTFRARVVIGADGANGIVRKKIAGHGRLSMVGLEIFTLPTQSELVSKQRRTAVFDFRCVTAGVQGYSWDFPAGTEATPLVNRGIFHSHIGGQPSRLNLKSHLVESLRTREIDTPTGEIKGHPMHMYDPSLPCSAPHVLLAGDAIGLEPLLGEGISSALETGIMAAEKACRALHTGDYTFGQYANDIRTSRRMRSTLLKRAVAERFYDGYPRWWILLGAVGMSGTYLRATQLWESKAGRSYGRLSGVSEN